MDRSLWLLLWLRTAARVRRWARGVRTLKGLLLALVGSLVFLPVVVLAVLTPSLRTGEQAALIRHYGPLTLLAYCVLNVVLSPGDRSVTYGPAEVGFLFSGPYRPRQLLLYKMAGGFGAAMVTAAILTLFLSAHAVRFVSAYVGLVFALELLTLFSLAVGLAAATVGALTFRRGRRALVAGLIGLAAAGAWSLGRPAPGLLTWSAVGRVVDTPALGWEVQPFRPFVMAFTAGRVWPDLVGWSLVCAAIDLAMVGVVLGLNAQFLEASAASSARAYDRTRRARRGERRSGGRVGRSLPMAPWWGGVGPNLWRQVTTASRAPWRVAALLAAYLVPVGLLSVVRSSGLTEGPFLPSLVGSTVAGVSVLASSLVGYDFRTDLVRMEDLKTLPIRPTRLVLGQLATPVLILCAGQWLSLALAACLSPTGAGPFAAAALLAPPANLLLVGVENLYFLWFPYQSIVVQSSDFQALGRQLLILFGKAACVGGVSALAAGAGLLGFWATGRPAAGVAVAWAVVGGCGLGLVPLVASSFEAFDVADGRAE